MTGAEAPFGSWDSPFSPVSTSAASVALSEPLLTSEGAYWLESVPTEGGRIVVMFASNDGSDPVRLTPEGFNVRTRVHEYGGGAYAVHDGVVFFANFTDQRWYRQEPGRPPRPLTPEPERSAALRFADPCVTSDGRTLIAVRERHGSDGSVVNDLVAFDAVDGGEPVQLAGGHDFVSSPRLSPDGSWLAWISWDQPNMPWDGTELWVARFDSAAGVREAAKVAGSPSEAILQPGWSPDGVLHFVNDRTGWWNLYRANGPPPDATAEPLAPMAAEFGDPPWMFGFARHAFLSNGDLVCTWIAEDAEHLGLLAAGALREVETGCTVFEPYLSSNGGRVAFVGSGPTEADAVRVLDTGTGRVGVVRRSAEGALEPADVSVALPVEFPTADGATGHALFYPPTNRRFRGPPGELPPLLVQVHGGPTSHSTAGFNVRYQFWTSRGFAVLDVDYAGSSGHGRAYRERLTGRWGVADVDDCVRAALHVAGQGLADRDRMAIRGGSAGGYAALCAVVFHDVFAAGASYFGVADLEGLLLDTHKFEARYGVGLVGKLPEAVATMRERSPVHFADRIRCPVILFQGLDDPVVPPAQAEIMVEAMRRNGVPFAYLAFEGEAHGFRRAESMRRSLEAELSFYGQVFGFEPAGNIEPVTIERPDEG